MSSDKFEYIIMEIPSSINKDTVKSLRSAVRKIDSEEAADINELLGLDIDDISGESLNEDDLFEIGEEGLRVKKVVQEFLNDAISQVIVPRMYCEDRLSSPLNIGEFSYVTIKDSPHVIAGQQVSYYSSKLNLGYKYVLGLSLSNILSEITSEVEADTVV